MIPASYIYDGLLQRGFTPVQAAALAGNMRQESSFNPASWNEKEGAGGLLQWRNDRLAALQSMAASEGKDWTDPDVQMDFIAREMTGPEAHNAKGFLAADDVQNANAALKRYIRYGDNTEPVRLKYAEAFVDPASSSSFQPAARAVNSLAGGNAPDANPLGGVPAKEVQTAQFVPPPFSGQKPNFAPLFPTGEDSVQTAPLPPVTQNNAPAAPVAPQSPSQGMPAAGGDVLKAWGLSDAASGTAKDAGAPSDPNEAMLKAWGLDNSAVAGNAPAASTAAAKTAAPSSSIGSAIGSAIDEGLGGIKTAGEKVATGIGNLWGAENNIARQVATGVPIIGGLANRADAATNAALAPILNPLFSPQNQLAGATFGERYKNALDQQNAADQSFQSAHPIVSTGAQLAGGIAGLGAAAGAIPGASTALGMGGGNLLARAALGGATGAAIGGTDAAIRSGGDADATRHGAIGGLVGGIAGPAVGDVAGYVGNKLFSVPQRVAELAQLARDKYGIDVTGPQIASNPIIKFLDSVVNRLPLSGGTAAKQAQQQAFNRAVADSFGENASELTPEVLNAAKKRIGSVFDSVAQRTPEIRPDQQFVDHLTQVVRDAEQTLPASEIEPIRKQIVSVLEKFSGAKPITGETYQALTRKGAPLDRLMTSAASPNVRYAAREIRDALDGALERSAPPAALADLQKARSQWKAMKTIEDLAEKAPTGDISPALLMGAARKSYGNMAYDTNAPDLVNLARIGQQFMKEAPSSGTAERNMLIGGLGGAGATMLLNPAAVPFAAAKAGGALLAGRALGTALRSRPLANAMIENSLRQFPRATPALSNLLLRSVPEGTVPAMNQLLAPRRPLEITVGRPAAQ